MSTLRQLLGGGLVIAPGIYDAFTARLVEEAGFSAAYLSGAGVSYSLLAQPDIGLVSLAEMATRVEQVCRATRLPVVADGDNGHGNALNVMRTVQMFEAAGAAAVQLEDQTFPKKCGHLEGKKLVGTAEMVGKIRAAVKARRSAEFLIVGRTDARDLLGLDAAIDRARRYGDAGADLLFVEAPRDREELDKVAHALSGYPLVANMVEGGKTPLLGANELAKLGYRLAIFPNSLMRRFAFAARELLRGLKETGNTTEQLPGMVSFGQLNELLRLPDLAALEREFVKTGDD